MTRRVQIFRRELLSFFLPLSLLLSLSFSLTLASLFWFFSFSFSLVLALSSSLALRGSRESGFCTQQPRLRLVFFSEGRRGLCNFPREGGGKKSAALKPLPFIIALAARLSVELSRLWGLLSLKVYAPTGETPSC